MIGRSLIFKWPKMLVVVPLKVELAQFILLSVRYVPHYKLKLDHFIIFRYSSANNIRVLIVAC